MTIVSSIRFNQQDESALMRWSINCPFDDWPDTQVLHSFVLFFECVNELRMVQSFERSRHDARIYGYVIEIVNGWKFISLSKEE